MLTALAEIDSAGKVSVMLLAALMFWVPPDPGGRPGPRSGCRPHRLPAKTAALAEATTSPPNCTLPPGTTSCTVTVPARLSPPRVTKAGIVPKSSVEFTAMARLVAGRLSGVEPLGVMVKTPP